VQWARERYCGFDWRTFAWPLVPGTLRSPRHRMGARCRLSQETRVQHALNDVASNICEVPSARAAAKAAKLELKAAEKAAKDALPKAPPTLEVGAYTRSR
jgi:hypothetical protein